MRLKIDAVTRQRSATQDGVRDKLAIRAQLINVDVDLDAALDLVGAVVDAEFVRTQERLPFDVAEEETAEEVVVPPAGRRRNGTRSSEQVNAAARE